MNKKKYTLTLDSDAFNSLKSDFNQILRSTLNNMIQKEGEKAEVKISLKITLTQSTAPDLEEHRYEAEREVIVPKFEHKVTSVMQYKDEKAGSPAAPSMSLYGIKTQWPTSCALSRMLRWICLSMPT